MTERQRMLDVFEGPFDGLRLKDPRNGPLAYVARVHRLPVTLSNGVAIDLAVPSGSGAPVADVLHEYQKCARGHWHHHAVRKERT